MTNTLLPAYFKEYLDERFKNVLDEIQGVKEDIKTVKDDVGDLKKTVSDLKSIQPLVKKNEKKINKIVLAIAIISVVLLINTLTAAEDSSWIHKLIPLLF